MKLRKNTVGRVLRGGGYNSGSLSRPMRVDVRKGFRREKKFRNSGFRFVVRGQK